MVGARVRRPQVAYARARGLSGRRACALLSVARSTLGYQSRLVDRDAPALAAMRRLAAQYPRYGYRRIRIFLKREGHTMSTDRTHRLWRQAGLQGHCQVGEKLVDRPPRYWAPARLEPTMLSIKNSPQPQLDNTAKLARAGFSRNSKHMELPHIASFLKNRLYA